MAQTIYDKYGGFFTLNNIIKNFYIAIKKDKNLAPYFEGVGMGKLIEHQTQFISSLVGGPQINYPLSLKDSHAHLNITEDHFNLCLSILRATLKEGLFSDEDIKVVLSEMIKSKNDIIK